MFYFLLAIFLWLVEWIYLRIAIRFQIIDIPNERSSYAFPTVRGGGIIYFFSVFVFFLFTNFQYPWLIIAILALAGISLLDDIKGVSIAIRMMVHLLAAVFICIQCNLYDIAFIWWIPIIVLLVGTYNAYNFMDGINGMHAFYSFTVIGGLWFVNYRFAVFDQKLLVAIAIANAIFAFYNARKIAKCFAGDTGSISLACVLSFLTLLCIQATHSLLPILFFTLYGLDVGCTLLQRIYWKENILEAHRQHLYQYLANEAGISHLAVSVGYMFLQLLITIGAIALLSVPVLWQWIAVGLLFIFLLMSYFLVIRWLYHKVILIKKS